MNTLQINSKQVIIECQLTIKWIDKVREETLEKLLEKYMQEKISDFNIFRLLLMKSPYFYTDKFVTRDMAYKEIKKNDGWDYAPFEKIFNSLYGMYHTELDLCRKLIKVATVNDSPFTLNVDTIYIIMCLRDDNIYD